MPSVNNALVQAGSDWVIGAKPTQFTGSRGVPNPFGAGASAYEPRTEIYTPGTDPLMRGSRLQVTGQSESDAQAAAKLAEAQNSATAGATANAGGGGAPVANGSVLSFINAAKQLLGKPYVWGGTSINGTDCSGLLYFAFNAAGIKMPRYRASDYGKMGQQVGADQARAGDIVYWDEPGATDHVGIYLGNGMVLNSPHSGTVTQINHVWGNPVYRRLIQDDQFGNMVMGPTGQTGPSYAGQPASSVFNQNNLRGIAAGPVPGSLGQALTTSGRTPDSGFKVRAI